MNFEGVGIRMLTKYISTLTAFLKLPSARMHSEGTVVGSVCLSVCLSVTLHLTS